MLNDAVKETSTCPKLFSNTNTCWKKINQAASNPLASINASTVHKYSNSDILLIAMFIFHPFSKNKLSCYRECFADIAYRH